MVRLWAVAVLICPSIDVAPEDVHHAQRKLIGTSEAISGTRFRISRGPPICLA